MSKNLPTDPMKGRTLYEQVRIVAKSRGWPDDAAHDMANDAVLMCGGNEKCKSADELNSVTREALRIH
jgi:hypothetical protein